MCIRVWPTVRHTLTVRSHVCASSFCKRVTTYRCNLIVCCDGRRVVHVLAWLVDGKGCIVQPQQMNLSQATVEALRFGGPQLLEEPKRFVGMLVDSDYVDTESSAATVLYHHCNEQYLSRYVAAMRERSAESILVACKAGSSYLHDGCGVDRSSRLRFPEE